MLSLLLSSSLLSSSLLSSSLSLPSRSPSLLSERGLRSLLLHAAAFAALSCGVLFIADVACTLLTRRGRAPVGVERLVRRSPALVRHLAELTVTGLLALGATRPAAASPAPIREWLSATTTTAPAAPPTTDATTAPTVPAMRPAPPSTAPTSTTTTPHGPTHDPAAGTRASPPLATPPLRAERTPRAVYVVRPGDCLWRIAAKSLGPGATNRTLDAAWRAIYAANRAAIGDNPGLIHPGLTLTLPPLPETR